jgi:ATP-binding cassette subfamily C protein LapB
VLVLDEPSNDLDFQSERTLLATLLAVAKVRTVVVVTHSLRIVSAASVVYHVTGQGNVEQGTAAVMVPKLFGVKKALVALPDSTAGEDDAEAHPQQGAAANRSMA